MRKRIIGSVVLALISVVILAALNINFLVRRNKEYVIGRMEQALGRKITADEIDATLWPLGARLVNFAVADDPDFSAGELLRAKNLRVNLRLLPLLVGRFRLERMVIEAPVVSIVRDARGRYNFASNARYDKRDRDRASSSQNTSPNKQDSELFLVASLNVSGGALRYRDLGNGGEITATQIDLKVNGFEWGEPFAVELEAAVMTAKPNLKFKSRIGPIAGARDYRDVPLDGNINADGIDLGRVNTTLPQFRKALPRALRFDGIYTIQGLRFKGTLNNLALKGAVTGTDASFRFE